MEWPDPLMAKEPALMSLVTVDPQASCLSRGAADIFWMRSKRPHFGQWYS